MSVKRDFDEVQKADSEMSFQDEDPGTSSGSPLKQQKSVTSAIRQQDTDADTDTDADNKNGRDDDVITGFERATSEVYEGVSPGAATHGKSGTDVEADCWLLDAVSATAKKTTDVVEDIFEEMKDGIDGGLIKGLDQLQKTGIPSLVCTQVCTSIA